MPRTKKTTAMRAAPISHEAVLARHLTRPDFQAEFERKRLIHEVAIAVRVMRIAMK